MQTTMSHSINMPTPDSTTSFNKKPDQHASILLVEDHHDLSEAVGAYLESCGFVVDYAYDGLCALHLGSTQNYDAIILDIMLPGVDGLEVCRKLRQEAKLSLPILMLTARDQLQDKLSGFKYGADDYLIKPFDMLELEARLHALIRRQRGEMSESSYQVGDLHFDLRTLQVTREGRTIRLSPTGLRILRILMRESPNLVTREQLEHELWGDLQPDSDTLRSHVYKLRKSIDKPFEKAMLETRQGVGFRLIAIS